MSPMMEIPRPLCSAPVFCLPCWWRVSSLYLFGPYVLCYNLWLLLLILLFCTSRKSVANFLCNSPYIMKSIFRSLSSCLMQVNHTFQSHLVCCVLPALAALENPLLDSFQCSSVFLFPGDIKLDEGLLICAHKCCEGLKHSFFHVNLPVLSVSFLTYEHFMLHNHYIRL